MAMKFNKTFCTQAILYLNPYFRQAPQSETVPLIIYITSGNIHPPKLYANLCQNVCITSHNDDNSQFYKWQCF